MKVSLNTVTHYTGLELPPVDELVQRINQQLGGVEEVVDLAAKYKDATVVKVVECEKHPDADKLSVCKIDAGTGELVQVVCGAPNVHADMWAVWLPPESVVPASFDDDEPFVLGARKLRGVMSQGMLAAGDELALNSDHDGIVEITEYDLQGSASKATAVDALTPGMSFAELFGLNDTIIDIENKMFTHRPDLFGQLGVAREVAGILGHQFASPEWYTGTPEFARASGLDLEVYNDASDIVPRFMAVAIQDVEVKPSPLWLQCELVRWGGKPINNIVDATNYIMLLTAQPTHAYDYDKLRGHKLGARMARAGETVTLLGGKTYELDESDIVIADGEGPVGLAGIMGGAESEVSASTKNIVLEVANFDMYAVRKSSMRHGVFTDALTRFNKGQSPLQNAVVLAKLMEMVGGEQASVVVDENPFARLDGNVVTDLDFINNRLGLTLDHTKTAALLENVEFDVTGVEGSLDIVPPFWRTDIEQPEDIVEEVGRLYGFDRLPRELPRRSARPAPRNPTRELARQVREALARAGASEVLTYSFVHERVLTTAGQDSADAYRLSNALSPDLQYYRLSLTPSLLDKVHANIKSGHDEFALFEIGKSHSKKAGLNTEGLPVEPGRIALAYASKTAREGAAYYHAKRMLDYLAESLGLALDYKPLPAGSSLTAAAPFAAGRSARAIDRASGQVIGIVGEYAPGVRRGFKLPDYAAGFELFTEGLQLACRPDRVTYRPLSRYPSVARDICFELAHDVPYGDLAERVRTALAALDTPGDFVPLDIYQPDEATRRITIRVTFAPDHATLTGDEATALLDQVAGSVAHDLGAVIV